MSKIIGVWVVTLCVFLFLFPEAKAESSYHEPQVGCYEALRDYPARYTVVDFNKHPQLAKYRDRGCVIEGNTEKYYVDFLSKTHGAIYLEGEKIKYFKENDWAGPYYKYFWVVKR